MNLYLLFDYDALDRLITFSTPTQKITYVYDASNRRLAKTTYSRNENEWKLEHTFRYLYQGSKEIGTYDEQGRITELRVLGQSSFGTEIGATVAIELRGKAYAPVTDSRGSIVGLIKAKDNISFETYRYSPFGEEQVFDQSGTYIEQALNPWRYASKRKDVETGLIYFGHRYYDPEIGRWLTADPAGFADGMNLYVFNHNNPLRYIDKDGCFAFLIPMVMIAFGTEVVITTTTVYAIAGTITGAALGYGVYEGLKYLDHRVNESSYGCKLANEAVDVEEKKKRHNGDQQAIIDLVKESGKKGITNEDADILLDLSNEYGFPSRDDRGKDHWVGGEHIHIGGRHVPIQN